MDGVGGGTGVGAGTGALVAVGAGPPQVKQSGPGVVKLKRGSDVTRQLDDLNMLVVFKAALLIILLPQGHTSCLKTVALLNISTVVCSFGTFHLSISKGKNDECAWGRNQT
jgi:hypothetical protein